jgi:hypothetical protein
MWPVPKLLQKVDLQQGWELRKTEETVMLASVPWEYPMCYFLNYSPKRANFQSL